MKKAGLLQNLILVVLVIPKNCKANVNSRLAQIEKEILSLTQQQESNRNDIQNLNQQTYNLQVKIDSSAEYCKLLSDNVCGACKCKDDYQLAAKHYCDCQNLQPKRDCLDFMQNGVKISGVYKIHQNNLRTIQVYCDQETDGGGWTVVQRRRDGRENFFRGWLDYRNGFGSLQNEFWLGNENIFTLCLQGLYPRGNEMRIDMKNNKNIKQHAKYKKFQLGNADTRYTLYVDDHTGTATNELMALNKNEFSTFDNDNDQNLAGNCAYLYGSGWWHGNCFATNLNGKYYPGGRMTRSQIATGIHWSQANSFSSHSNSLILTEMKVRRRL